MEMEYETEENELELSMEDPESPDAMDEEQFGAVVKAAIDDAENYIDDYIAPRRELSMSFYRGDFLGNEEEGRSQVVMTEVRDTIQAMMAMDMDELKSVWDNKHATILEKTIANAMMTSLKKGSLYSLETLLSRAFGNPKQMTELTGANSEPIQIIINDKL